MLNVLRGVDKSIVRFLRTTSHLDEKMGGGGGWQAGRAGGQTGRVGRWDGQVGKAGRHVVYNQAIKSDARVHQYLWQRDD